MMQIKTETVQDYRQVYDLNVVAFENREDEARLVERIRSSEGSIPELSIVAIQDEGESANVIGHVLFSKASVIDRDIEHPVIVLAPVAVHPDSQRQGVGQALIREGLRRCQALDYGLVLLIGHPSYYPKLGFKPARPYGLELKQFEVPDDVFMVHECIEGRLAAVKGELRYPAVFLE
ncbi:GNAT family N-acetyltransferase [Paenibacillus sp. GCM10012306]|uniref:GNAT family N-acetyltransferase n=1 Tax=Paenibacillus sp. GCM10012306 TaxID=3317342 RepID=UPI003612789E